MPEAELKEERRSEFASRFKEFLRKKYYKEIVKAAHSDQVLDIDFQLLDKASPEMTELLLNRPEYFFELAQEAIEGIELPSPVSVRFFNLPESSAIPIRNLRSKHIGKFTSVEGMVRKASEIRPELVGIVWKCPACDNEIEVERKGNFIGKPYSCECGNKAGFTQKEKKMIDMRWIMIEEPFELTEGDRPSQVNLVLKGSLTTPDFRRMTDPGSRLLMTGVLKEIPKGKFYNVKLDFYMDVNHIEPKEIGWERVDISKEDEEEIKKMSNDPRIYENLVASLAPTLYGMEDIKESIVLQMFGGIRRVMPDKTKSRGDIHILLIGDPASGKSQLLKLAPEIVPRGKYVSGKGTTTAGLCTTHDSLIQLGNGKLVKIGRLVEKELKKGAKEIKNGVFVAETPTEREIVSFDQKNLKTKGKKITQYFKIKAPPKLVKITTRTGRNVIVTPENPIPVLNNGKVMWKQAGETFKNEQIVCQKNTHESKNEKEKESDFSDIFWDKIKSIEIIENKNHEWVYDVTVEGEHSFVCNGIIIHNTASVSKDEQFMGGWVLEAGAMVLANKGILAVDEFEKMSPEDQVAMHEGLEQGSVSIAKASIIATLPAQTSVLAGGNPKFSRFDPYMPIAKQIIIPDTLLSRFDLKFALRDVPESAKDKLVVDHMLSTREDGFEGAIPRIPPETIRKYIAYAKKNCLPVLTKEAGKTLKSFYLKTRKKAESGVAISITLRQFEALIRLSEAAAKIQLSPEVKKDHALRAIKLMRASLKQLGFDPDTGEIDVDRAEGVTTAKERSGIRIILDIINTLSEKKKEVLIDEIKEAAKKEKIEPDTTEEILDKLKNEGMLFNPSPNYVQKV